MVEVILKSKDPVDVRLTSLIGLKQGYCSEEMNEDPGDLRPTSLISRKKGGESSNEQN